MDFNDAYLFVNVVKAGSFSEAARSLAMPLSTVSDRVAALEKSLGVTLLTRTTRVLRLTEAGLEFFKQAETATNLLTQASESVSSLQQKPRGVLKITAPADFASSVMAEAIADYRSRFPDVRVEVHLSNRYVDLIGEGFDIAIRGGVLKDSSLMAKRIGSGHQILIASEKYLSRNTKLRHPKDLKEHSCIGYMNKDVERAAGQWQLQKDGSNAVRIKLDYIVSVNSFATLMDLVKSGLGIGLMPLHFCAEELKRGTIVHALPAWRTSTAPVHIVYPQQRFHSPKVKEMIPILERGLRTLMEI